MASLTSKQRAHLRSLAQRLKALLHVGKEGVTDTLVRSTMDAFNTRELLKVKVLESAPDDAPETAQHLLKRLEDVELVQVIGRTIVLYRTHPEKPEIRLPKQIRE
jgi:RNA-binding protein